MARQQVFVIKNSAGLFYTDCEIVGTKDVIEQDGTGNKYVHARHILAPRFVSSRVDDASKFGTEQDAKDMMANPALADANAFAGCTVVSADD